MNDATPIHKLLTILDDSGEATDIPLCLELLIAVGRADRASVAGALRDRLLDALSSTYHDALDLAQAGWNAGLLEVEDFLTDPFWSDEPEATDSFLEALSTRDRLEFARRGIEVLGLSTAEQSHSNAEDERLRAVLDSALVANDYRREAVPPEDHAWWWTYRLDCDSALLAREETALSTADREALEAHCASCSHCAEERVGAEVSGLRIEEAGSSLSRLCPPALEMHRFARGTLPRERSEVARIHMALCPSCPAVASDVLPAETLADPALVSLTTLATAGRELVAFASDSPEDALEPLRTLCDTTGELAEGDAFEFAVARFDGRPWLLIHAADRDEVALTSAPADLSTPPVAETALRPTHGLFRLDLTRESAQKVWILDLGAEGTRVVDEALTYLQPSAIDPDLGQIEHALALGNGRLAGDWLSARAEGLEPGIRRALWKESAACLKTRLDKPKAARGRVGAVETLVAWRGWGGRISVEVNERPSGRSGLMPKLEEALTRAGSHGALAAQRALGLSNSTEDCNPSLTPSPHDLGLQGTGESLGLAAALAAYSRCLELPVPGDCLVTGVLDPETGEVRPVKEGLLGEKFRAAARERSGARVLVPSGQQSLLPEELQGTLEVQGVATFKDATDLLWGPGHCARVSKDATQGRLQQAFDAERERKWDKAIKLARAVCETPGVSDRHRFRALWLIAACLVHRAEPEVATDFFAKARALIPGLKENEQLESEDLVYLCLAEADQKTDTFEFEAALKILLEAREQAPSNELRAKVFGLHGMISLYAGHLDQSVSMLEEALSRTSRPLDRGRFFCWSALAHTARGEWKAAATAVEAGMACSSRFLSSSGQAQGNQIYLLRARARLELAQDEFVAAEGSVREALELMESESYPRSSLRHLLGRALVAQGQEAEGLKVLKETPATGQENKVAPFEALLTGLPSCEFAAVLLERNPDLSETKAALKRARALLQGYPPANARFAEELAHLDEPSEAAAEALRRILKILPY